MEHIPRIKTTIWLILMGVALGFLISAILIVIMARQLSAGKMILILLIGELFLPIPVLIWSRRNQTSIRKLLRWHRPDRKMLIATLPVACGLTILVDALDRLTAQILPMPEKFLRIEELLKITGWQSAFLVIGVVVVAAPLVEELLFRGFLQRVLEYRMRDITRAVLVSALTFALIHLNIYWVIQIYMLGVFMGYLAWRSDSILPSFIVHALNNGWSIAWLHWGPQLSWYLWRGDWVNPLVVIAGLVLLLWGLKLFASVPIQDRELQIDLD